MKHSPTDGSRTAYALSSTQPSWIEPMRAVVAEAARMNGPWLWEPRFTGVRCLAFVHSGQVRLRTGRGLSLNEVLPSIAKLLPVLVRGNAILDGVYGGGVLHLFDCLHYEGVSLRPLPLLERKAVLRDCVWFDDLVRFTPYRTSSDADCQSPAAAGVVAKRADSAYVSGASRDWIALASAQAREFVIGGYVQRPGSHVPSALLIGAWQGDRLLYAGRVKAACEPGAFHRVATLLRRIRRRTSPFESAVPQGPHIHWTSPALVARIGFSEWTAGGLLRQPRFIGLRFDRAPEELRQLAR
jgi:bifunctional non-homologous end joining protein LigD